MQSRADVRLGEEVVAAEADAIDLYAYSSKQSTLPALSQSHSMNASSCSVSPTYLPTPPHPSKCNK